MKKKRKVLTCLAAGFLTAAVGAAWYLENNDLGTTQLFYQDDKLPAAFDGFRIVQVADLHDKRFGPRQERLLSALRAAKPDCIVMTGDLIDRRRKGGFRIRLAHHPERFATYAQAGVDLVFCGHAHGGQFRLPGVGGLYAPGQGVFPKYTAGLYTMEATTMIVSRGLGNSLFPLRLHNFPELVAVTLKKGIAASEMK